MASVMLTSKTIFFEDPFGHINEAWALIQGHCHLGACTPACLKVYSILLKIYHIKINSACTLHNCLGSCLKFFVKDGKTRGVSLVPHSVMTYFLVISLVLWLRSLNSKRSPHCLCLWSKITDLSFPSVYTMLQQVIGLELFKTIQEFMPQVRCPYKQGDVSGYSVCKACVPLGLLGILYQLLFLGLSMFVVSSATFRSNTTFGQKMALLPLPWYAILF